MTVNHFFVSAVALILCFSKYGHAGDTVDSSSVDMADAAQWFKTGVAHFKNENYPAALSAFSESYTLKPKASILYNIAMCYKAQYKYVAAIDTFNKYIGTASDDAPELARANEELRFLQSQVAKLDITGLPEDAQVRINGREITNYSPAIVNPGDCRLTVSTDGFEAYEVALSLGIGEEITHEVTLIPKQGALSVTCDAPNVALKLNHRPVGECPLDIALSPGSWILSADADGKLPYSKEFFVAPGEQVALDISLSNDSETASTSVTSLGAHADTPAKLALKAPTESMHGIRIASIILTATGVAAITFGTAWAIKGRIDHNRAKESTDNVDREHYDEHVLPRNNAIMTAGLVTGVVTISAAIALLLVKRKKQTPSEHQTRVRFRLQPQGASIFF